MVKRFLPFAILIATAPCGWLACNIIFGIDPPELVTPKQPLVDSGPPVDETGCAKVQWPKAPLTEDGTSDISFVVALKEIGLSTDPPNPVTGYDLDNVCTCPGPRACVPTTMEAGTHCDDPGGRDLSMNRNVFAVILQSPGFSTETLNANLQKGRYGILAEISGYNGGKNDKAVTVAMYLSSGTSGDAGPGWDGGDPWDLDPRTLESDAGPPRPAYVDRSAYVADGVLVASSFSGVKLSIGVGSEAIDLELGQSVFTAKIVPRAGTFAFTDGIIAGRWPTKNILSAIAPLTAPGLGVPLCSPIGKPLYDYAKGVVCRSADLSTNPIRDLDRGAECDALSFAMRFTAEPAKLGSVRAKLNADAGCLGWNDDCTKP